MHNESNFTKKLNMTELKYSILPHVLKEYNPEYEPKPSARHPAVHRCYTDGYIKQTEKPRHALTNGRAKTTLTQKPREKTRGRRGIKTDEERYEELSLKWDQAKQEVREEDHEHLKEKIALQQELIKRQDEYAHQRRVQIAEQEQQALADVASSIDEEAGKKWAERRNGPLHLQKEAEKAKKAAKEEEFRQICKQSLKEDKKAVKKDKSAPVNTTKSLPNQKQQDDSSTVGAPPSSLGSGKGRRGTGFQPALSSVSATPDVGPDVDDNDNDDDGKSVQVPEDALWHEQQLYKLYGKNADYFLHPKMETHEQVKKTNPKLRRHGGQAGADVLWQTLRHDSNLRLMKEDANIPKELKEAYGAFARQVLQKHELPVRRMYYVEDDLPEMDKLLDNRQLQKIRKMRHKSDLMYRASVSNQDRTEVITFNNPLPEFHDPKPESINRYLPSWLDDESVSTQPEYMKWIGPGLQAPENTIYEEGVESPRQPQMTQSFDDDLILILSRKKRNAEKPKYIFLSEKDATVKGEFSEKFKDEKDNKGIPKPYQGDRPKAYSAMGMGMVSATPDRRSGSCYSAPIPTREELLRSYTSNWQPLTMHALVEYKKQVNTIGEGDFNLGRTKMWSNIPILEKT